MPPSKSDNDAERSARVEHMLEDARRSHAKAVQMLKDAKRTVAQTEAAIQRIQNTLSRRPKGS